MAPERNTVPEQAMSKAEPKVTPSDQPITMLHLAPSTKIPPHPQQCDQAMAPQSCAAPCEQQLPHTPTSYAGYATHPAAGMLSSQQMFGAAAAWQGQQFSYVIPSQMPSPSMGSTTSFSPNQGLQSPGQNPVAFPDSPQLMDAAQMLRSPSRFRKRRQLSPLISSYGDPTMGSPQQPTALAGPISPFLRRMSMPKIPVSPSSPSVALHSSPRSRTGNLILPCFFDNNNNLRVHGPHTLHHHQQGSKVGNGSTSYWDDSRRTILSFLKEAEAIDEENITIIEIKQLLRRYSLSATGKKTVLMDRIRRAQAHFKADMEREEQIAAQTLASNSPKSESVHLKGDSEVGVIGSS